MAKRINIYVPDELKGRMDRVGDRNWSAAAQRAFEIECQLKEIMMGTEDSVVARLRASKAKEDEADLEFGRKAGQEWARTAAEYGELRRVAECDYWDQLNEDQRADTLACLILDANDARDLDQHSVRELWDHLHDRTDAPDPAWIEGFVAGAAEIWDEVADKI
jgi:hypothetical protein